MSYSPNTTVWREQIRVALEAGGCDKVWAGIGAYRQAADSTVAKIRLGRELGVRGFSLFSYNFTVRKGELNPNADYLQAVKRAAFPNGEGPTPRCGQTVEFR
jgi:hypothetical protein